MAVPFWLLLAGIMNAIGVWLMGWDKARAVSQGRRIPERVFWLIACGLGAAGIWLGMAMFRHKTQTLSFRLMIPLICLIQLALGAWLLREGLMPW